MNRLELGGEDIENIVPNIEVEAPVKLREVDAAITLLREFKKEKDDAGKPYNIWEASEEIKRAVSLVERHHRRAWWKPVTEEEL